MKKILIVLLLVVVVAVGAWLFTWWRSPKIGHVKDEAQLAGLGSGSGMGTVSG